MPESWAGRSLEVDVGAVAQGGHCVARVGGPGGRVVFVRHAGPGERVRWLALHGRAAENGATSGPAKRLVGLIQDVTDRHHLEEQLLPASTWGKHYAIARAKRADHYSDYVRVVAQKPLDAGVKLLLHIHVFDHRFEHQVAGGDFGV